MTRTKSKKKKTPPVVQVDALATDGAHKDATLDSSDAARDNDDAPLPAPLLTGTVLRAAGGLYEVDTRGESQFADAFAPNADAFAPNEAERHEAEKNATGATNNLPSSATSGQDRDKSRKSRGEAGQANAAAIEKTSADDIEDETLWCSVRGLLKHGRKRSSQPVSVGDRVRVRPSSGTGVDARGRRMREGNIEEVLPRQKTLARSRFNKTDQVSVANLDQAVVVMALREPDFNAHRLDRFLVLAEASDLKAVICFSKSDLLKKRELKKETQPLLDLYRGLGYTAFLTSEETPVGIEELRHALGGHISAFIGSSGVGKSSLLNAVQPGLHLWVGDVMEMGKGRHTTTDVSLHRLRGAGGRTSGYIADTPGVKTVSLLEREDVDVALCFPEFAPLWPGCRFSNCSHVHEPGCAVRAAAAEGSIAASRYESYLKIRSDAALPANLQKEASMRSSPSRNERQDED
jgi:ribosome biogenesis GTPase